MVSIRGVGQIDVDALATVRLAFRAVCVKLLARRLFRSQVSAQGRDPRR